MTAPAATTASRISRETEAPALNRAISTPSKLSGVISCTVISPPRKGSFWPAERAEARARTSLQGKSRASRHVSISRPTAPEAPATATTGFAGIGLVHAMLAHHLHGSFGGIFVHAERGVKHLHGLGALVGVDDR